MDIKNRTAKQILDGEGVCEGCYMDVDQCLCHDTRKSPGYYEIDGVKHYYAASDSGSADRTTERGDHG